VYAYQHIGNLRAYVFADTLRRVLKWKGYEVTHVINITDVGHLTSDMGEGEDKPELASREEVPAGRDDPVYLDRLRPAGRLRRGGCAIGRGRRPGDGLQVSRRPQLQLVITAVRRGPEP
jgi:hypothetical protein